MKSENKNVLKELGLPSVFPAVNLSLRESLPSLSVSGSDTLSAFSGSLPEGDGPAPGPGGAVGVAG